MATDKIVLSGILIRRAVPWLRRLVAGLPPRRPGFDPGSVHVGFVVDKVALGQVFSQVLRFSLLISFHWDRFFPEYFGFPLNIIPLVIHY
jgi:hypothetical protein